MHALHIRRVATRYRLRQAELAARERLDAALRSALEDVLPGVLAREGICPDELICVRELALPLRIRLESSDTEISLAWGAAFASALRCVLARGGQPVIRYSSRVHALSHMLIATAQQDLQHAWAWRNLGLWRDCAESSRAALVDMAAAVLCEEPRAIVPLLCATASQSVLEVWLQELPAKRWLQLANAALRASGAGGWTLGDLAATSNEPLATQRLQLSASKLFEAARASTCALEAQLRRREPGGSAVPAAISGSAHATTTPRGDTRTPAHAAGLAQQAARTRALAALVALELAPELPSRGALQLSRWLHAIELALREPASRSTTSNIRYATADKAAADVARRSAPFLHAPEHSLALPPSAASPPRLDQPVRPSTPEATERHTPAAEPEAACSAEPVCVRVSGATPWGGLLLLLHACNALSIPEQLAALATRSLRFGLHRLAQRLVGADPRDPALLAFAGLAPDADPPEGPALTPEEAHWIAQLSTLIGTWLQTRLNTHDTAPDSLVAQVCARRAEIISDPGWIDVQFDLADVSIDIRRAGLDLDPGWLAWLGVVVRFRYV